MQQNYIMKYKYISLIFCILYCNIFSQKTKNVLFLGNSYTEVNNLPSLIKNIANSTGNDIVYDSNTPGGYTLQGHAGNNISQSKIMQGNWDFVVLQEQSQIPSFPDNYVNTNMFPYAKKLDSLINHYNPCAETIFYMTWGRKNGDTSNCASNPVICTYIGMDNAIRNRYEMMANQNQAILSPVGAVWRYIRTNFPSIELYSSDESHPSLEGSYAAACAFYTVIFRENPNLITYNSTLDPVVAAQIRAATQVVVYNQMAQWNVGKYDLDAHFSYNAVVNSPMKIQFTPNYSFDGPNYFWDFGDGQTSTSKEPIHQYNNTGNFSVKLTLEKCGETQNIIQSIAVNNLNTHETPKIKTTIFPNPTQDYLYIKGGENLVYYQITDASGRLLKNEKISRNEIFIGNFSKGKYLLFLKDKNQNTIITQQIIKK